MPGKPWVWVVVLRVAMAGDLGAWDDGAGPLPVDVSMASSSDIVVVATVPEAVTVAVAFKSFLLNDVLNIPLVGGLLQEKETKLIF